MNKKRPRTLREILDDPRTAPGVRHIAECVELTAGYRHNPESHAYALSETAKLLAWISTPRKRLTRAAESVA